MIIRGVATLVMLYTIPIPPVPASRARVTRYGSYHLPKYKEYLDTLGKWFASCSYQAISGPVAVRLAFICDKPAKPAKPYPQGDLDNYEKGVLDATTRAGVWADDRQVVALSSSKRYAQPGERPHIMLEILEVDLSAM